MLKKTTLALALVLLLGAASASAASLPLATPPAEGPVTAEQALQIALDQAGLSAEDVMVSQAEEEIDDGRRVFELEFRHGFTEYECEIDALTGQILEWDADIDD